MNSSTKESLEVNHKTRVPIGMAVCHLRGMVDLADEALQRKDSALILNRRIKLREALNQCELAVRRTNDFNSLARYKWINLGKEDLKVAKIMLQMLDGFLSFSVKKVHKENFNG